MGSVEASVPVRVIVGLFLAFTGLIALFVVGVTMTDPGGLQGAAFVALWVVPMVALMAFCWFRPASAEWVMVGLSALVAVGIVVSALVSDVARDLEDDRGPIRAIVLLALGGILAVLALHRPITSGRTLTALGAIVFLTGVAGPRSRPLAIIALPLLLAGALIWILAAASERDKPALSQ